LSDDKTATLELLIDWVPQEPDEDTRAYLVYLLASNGRSDAKAYEALLAAATDDTKDVRTTAINGLAQWSSFPQALSYLIGRASGQSEDTDVRVAAIAGLARRWGGEERVQKLMQSLTGDKNPTVRALARNLAKCISDE
jgi:HEAT repeat protein